MPTVVRKLKAGGQLKVSQVALVVLIVNDSDLLIDPQL